MEIDALFAAKSDEYASFRPHYPEDVFDWAVAQAGGTSSAWDCATGNGQAAQSLATRFNKVVATDLNAEQIKHAPSIPNVTFRVARAENSGLKGGSVDLVVVAQALHWFDTTEFWAEVRRVLRSSGLFFAFGYTWPIIGSVTENDLVEQVRKKILPYWAKNNRILWEGYPSAIKNCDLPLLEVPAFEIVEAWSAEHLFRYMMTWSAAKRCVEDGGADDLQTIFENYSRKFDVTAPLEVRMPLTTYAARVPS